LGVFFSGTDRYTQRNFFNHPYSIGLVIDPIRDEDKVFIGQESDEVGRIFFYRKISAIPIFCNKK